MLHVFPAIRTCVCYARLAYGAQLANNNRTLLCSRIIIAAEAFQSKPGHIAWCDSASERRLRVRGVRGCAVLSNGDKSGPDACHRFAEAASDAED